MEVLPKGREMERGTGEAGVCMSPRFQPDNKGVREVRLCLEQRREDSSGV